ncbi:MAG: Crp/Fnr family transcriptional regulator [Candidatus Aminicenantes bacterium]
MTDLIEDIKNLGSDQTFQKDEFLFHAEDKAQGFYYVKSGEVRVFRMDDLGKEVEVVRLGPGDFFGEAIVFASDRFPAFAQSVRDTEVLFFPKDVVLRYIDREPAVARFFISLLAKKCIVLNKRIETLELKTVRQRLAKFLLTLCQGKPSCEIDLKMKKIELARLTGTIPETLSRNLRKMQEDGIIEVRGHTVLVRDCARLKHELHD